MTRRTFFSLAGAAGAATRAAFPQAPQGYPGTPYRDYSRCLPDYLRRLAAGAYERRNREIAKLTTPDAIRARQKWVRETFWRLAGGMPERTPLNPRTTGAFERDSYRVEKILYESRPKFFIPANLYIPTRGTGPFPGILFQMGHSTNGKAYASYQRCCQGLVRLGFVVLAFDPMGQGERIYYPASAGAQSRLGSADDEHTVPGKQMLLYGDTSTRLQVWDAIRCLDYLASLPSVDPKRLGSTGQSGGGTLTMFLACADDRLAAAAVCSGNTENIACRNYNPPGATDDAEQNFLFSGPAGFDRWDTLYPIAPKPLLVGVSDKDFFGTYSSNYLSSGWEEYQKLAGVYKVLGAGDRLDWADTPLPHGLAYDSRLSVYRWFSRWLKNDTNPIDREPPTAPEHDKTLWVGPTGSVVNDFGSDTPFTLNRNRKVTKTAVDLAGLVGAARPAAETALRTLRMVPSRDVDIEAVEVQSAPDVWLPAWVFLPRNAPAPRSVFLLLEPATRNSRWHEGELYQALASRGHAVGVPNLRGIDDLSPEFPRGRAQYARDHQDEENFSWASLILGRPMLGQWVTDILAVSAALKNRFRGARLVAAAFDKLTVPSLFAAALDPSIAALYLAHGLASFQAIVDAEDYRTSFANFVPGLLNHTDLPDVAAAIAPRPVTLAGAVDAHGAAMDVAALRGLYPRAELRPEARWDLESILLLTDKG